MWVEGTPIEDVEAAVENILNGAAPVSSVTTANMIKGWLTEVNPFAFNHVSALMKIQEITGWQLAENAYAANHQL
jgi:hypothetical protein